MDIKKESNTKYLVIIGNLRFCVTLFLKYLLLVSIIYVQTTLDPFSY